MITIITITINHTKINNKQDREIGKTIGHQTTETQNSKTGHKEDIKTTNSKETMDSNQETTDFSKTSVLTIVLARALNSNNNAQDTDVYKTSSSTQETNVLTIGIFKNGF